MIGARHTAHTLCVRDDEYCCSLVSPARAANEEDEAKADTDADADAEAETVVGLERDPE